MLPGETAGSDITFKSGEVNEVAAVVVVVVDVSAVVEDDCEEVEGLFALRVLAEKED